MSGRRPTSCARWSARAGGSIVLESLEEERALSLLERVASGARAAVRDRGRWRSASAPPGDGDGSLDAGLQAIEAPRGARRCSRCSTRTAGSTTRWRCAGCAICCPRSARASSAWCWSGPAFDLPPEIEREAGRVALPLPSRRRRWHKLLRRVCEQQKLVVRRGGARPRRARRARAPPARGDPRAAQGAAPARRSTSARSPRSCATSAARCAARPRSPSTTTPPSSPTWAASASSSAGSPSAGARSRTTPAAFGLPTPRGLLLLGVQGCGKSLSAQGGRARVALPAAAPRPRRRVRRRASARKRVLREAIQVAESVAPAVLWIDEIEKGFAATRAGHRVPSACSARSSPGCRRSARRCSWWRPPTTWPGLPPELLRRGRFDELFFVDLPTPAERARDPAHPPDPPRRATRSTSTSTTLAAAAERLTGAELEQVVAAALYTAFAESREVADADLANAPSSETVPIYDTYEERIKELRDWARGRARLASLDARIVDFFATGPAGAVTSARHGRPRDPPRARPEPVGELRPQVRADRQVDRARAAARASSCRGSAGSRDAKDEIQTYACAATDPEVYARWGTHPPSGRAADRPARRRARSCSRARSRRLTETSFLCVRGAASSCSR